jgi:broad specificity phosphatase PhoE
VHALRAQYVNEPFTGGESYADVVRRVRLFLGDASRKHGAGTVLVIAHRAPHYAFEHLLNGGDLAALVAGEWQWQPGWVYETDRQELQADSSAAQAI